MNSYEILVSGRVQGVGFRMYAKQLADRQQVYGTVRNLSDGHVKIIAQTDSAEQIQTFCQALKDMQPRYMRIEDLTCQSITLDKTYQDFQIVY
ncbi:acylphosphatase [Suicoccus acidiformans]|uniref:acylphosphatase n=1 Tax=Suicoccus acidiformans TaxID=2036206 RepID=A0A347WLC5_9LACT|nr:acylphosphatase [Suicoccus acidiformans]AXY25882.1 acylphosphatase [Suicoccus acidiformans]